MSRKSRINDARNAAAREEAARARRNRWILIGVAVVVIIALIIGAVVLNGDKAPTGTTNTTNGVTTTNAPAGAGEQTGEIVPVATHWVEIEVAGYGTITAELYGNVAPITVENFVKLAGEGFYDGLTFHRIISGFMIQGGCPNGNGMGGSGKNIKGEFASNGVNNPILHERGVLSMARSGMPDSASSQFFIMHEVSPWLDGEYAAFGRVLTGMEVVDAICANTPVTDGNGSVAKVNQPVITAIRVIEKPVEEPVVEEPAVELPQESAE